MNKYRDKSDFEINKAVAVSLGYTAEYENESVTVFRNNNGGMPLVVSLTADSPDNFDPCNNPADAMPIIIENKIDLTHLVGDMVCAKHKEYWCIRKNPSRAGCEVYLLMKDAENEK